MADSEQGFKTLLTPAPDRTLLSEGLDVIEGCLLFPRKNQKRCPARYMRNLKKHIFPQRKSKGIGLSLGYSTVISTTQNKILLVSGNTWEAKSLLSLLV